LNEEFALIVAVQLWLLNFISAACDAARGVSEKSLREVDPRAVGAFPQHFLPVV